MEKDQSSSCEMKQQQLQGISVEAVAMETVSKEIDMETTVSSDDDDDESEIEDGEVVSGSSSESELEPEEIVQERGKRCQFGYFMALRLHFTYCHYCVAFASLLSTCCSLVASGQIGNGSQSVYRLREIAAHFRRHSTRVAPFKAQFCGKMLGCMDS